MKVQLERRFALPGSADTAWILLQDIEKVAGCMPGARSPSASTRSTTRARWPSSSDRPACRSAVTSRSSALEQATKILRIVGKGTDTTGSSGASMDLTARVEAIDASVVHPGGQQRSVDERQGRGLRRPHDELGGRSESSSSSRHNFAAQVQALQAASRHRRRRPSHVLAGGGAVPASAAAAQPASHRSSNGLALIWAVIKDWLRSLFAAKKA